MKKLLKDYQSWISDNKYIYEHLATHQSILYNRFQPVYEVLSFLYEESNSNEDSFNEDIEKIFQVGLEYLNMQFVTCKIYLEKNFNNDFHDFLHYDRVIAYLLFIEDLRYELLEKKIKFNQEELDELSDYLESIIIKKQPIQENLSLYVDARISKTIKTENYHFTGIIDIFVEIADTLGIDFFEEQEYILGKDLENE
jgi:hypothetical protein